MTGTKTGATTTTRDQYVWMSASHRFWLMLTETTTAAGFPSELTWWATNPVDQSVGIVAQEQEVTMRLLGNVADAARLQLQVSTPITADIHVFDLTGKQVLATGPRSLSGTAVIELPELQQGMYLLHVEGQGNSWTERFIVR